MKKDYIIDSQLEPNLIDVENDERTAEEVLDDYLKGIEEQFGKIEIIEDHGSRKLVRVTIEVKVVDVPTKEDWNSIEK